jgi:hypothetical protein
MVFDYQLACALINHLEPRYVRAPQMVMAALDCDIHSIVVQVKHVSALQINKYSIHFIFLSFYSLLVRGRGLIPPLFLPPTALCIGGNGILDNAISTSDLLTVDLNGHAIVSSGIASSTIASVDGGVVLLHDCFLSFLFFEVLSLTALIL